MKWLLVFIFAAAGGDFGQEHSKHVTEAQCEAAKVKVPERAKRKAVCVATKVEA